MDLKLYNYILAFQNLIFAQIYKIFNRAPFDVNQQLEPRNKSHWLEVDLLS